jgi:hypothetical protein
MSLAMCVGSNYQLQNIVFGQALLRDESAESFAGYLQCLRRVCMDMSHMFYLLVSVFL